MTVSLKVFDMQYLIQQADIFRLLAAMDGDKFIVLNVAKNSHRTTVVGFPYLYFNFNCACLFWC